MKFKLHNNPTKDLLIKAGVGVVVVWLGDKVIKNLKKDNTESQVETNTSVGQAQGLRQAINPSGNNWMRKFDGTDTTAIFSIAKEITDIEAVRLNYKNLYNTSLYEDLQGELSAEDYQKFLSLATKGKVGPKKYAPTRNDILPTNWVITTSNANVRTTPLKTSKYNPLNNILKVVAMGKILGITTGKFVYDEPNDVVFIEFYAFTTKKEKKIFYVAKSQVELLTQKDKLERDKKGKTPLEVLEGIDEVETLAVHKQEVISIEDAEIYTENFKAVGIAPKGIIIGFPIMTLDTGKGKYIKVTTVQGLIRWIKAELVVIRDRNI